MRQGIRLDYLERIQYLSLAKAHTEVRKVTFSPIPDIQTESAPCFQGGRLYLRSIISETAQRKAVFLVVGVDAAEGTVGVQVPADSGRILRIAPVVAVRTSQGQ